ncbi:hypothetical protein DFA_09026 [Cavenderia fasciculata]|uniref:CN hydrolase domain-containing protein n=1 Tax=Cavenderia fasciculata TaxID=261658 RepID=F4Q6H8_CACFS|nr:uncharacterized protein DFA_09026 [Cavenderia fasciculata]EGG16488.1 hypothetical protein DFA_09026 [Cavenderia fasciculata]|eukprot:XP_004354888.1 hypothetical protein DFA_09026 [Cavenderia fasciculata]
MRDKLLLLSFILTLTTIVKASIDSSSAASYYTAAVVDYAPSEFHIPPLNATKELADEYMLSNVKNYAKYIEQASKSHVDIIVFPEYGIIGGQGFQTRDQIYPYLEEIPNVIDQIIPCKNKSYNDYPITQSLSCLAKQYNMVVVAVMGDVVYCTNSSSSSDCPEDGRFQYNTQVAFSNQGMVIGKYHKSHLYGNEGQVFNEPSVPDIVVFDTHFNVTFGMMICFDILFEQPQLELLQVMGVKNIVYSTEWINANYAYARQVQQYLSYFGGANILASNVGTYSITSGSGIFSSGTPLVTDFNPNLSPASTIAITKVPIIDSSTNKDRSPRIIKDSVEIQSLAAKYKMSPGRYTTNMQGVPPNSFNSTFEIFKPESNQQEIIYSTNNGFQCKFSYETLTIPGDQYFALISFNNNFNTFWDAQICTMAACLDNTTAGCSALVFDSQTIFTNLVFSGDFDETLYHVNAMVYTTNDKSDYYSQYDQTTSTFDITGMNEPVMSISLFAPQWYQVNESN